MGKRHAFTLIELLIVVSIIGLLIAIIVPGVNKARTQASRTACATRLRQIGIGLQAYLADSSDRMPAVSFMPSVGPLPLGLEEPVYIADVLNPYVGKQSDLFRCPQDRPGVQRADPNDGKSYFQSERSSYEFRIQLNGRILEQHVKELQGRLNRPIPVNGFWIMRDYNNFHGKGGTTGSRRYLYIDNHVTDFEQF